MKLSRIIDQLDRNGKVYQSLLGGFNQQESVWKPSPERWSLLEIVGHLIDIEIEDFRYDLEITLFCPEAAWPSFDIEAWVEERKYNERDLSPSLKELWTERHRSIDWLSGLGEIDYSKRHSGTGFSKEPMRAGDILASWLAHDHFHIRQIALLSRDILDKNVKPYSSDYSGFDH